MIGDYLVVMTININRRIMNFLCVCYHGRGFRSRKWINKLLEGFDGGFSKSPVWVEVYDGIVQAGCLGKETAANGDLGSKLVAGEGFNYTDNSVRHPGKHEPTQHHHWHLKKGRENDLEISCINLNAGSFSTLTSVNDLWLLWMGVVWAKSCL